MKEALCTRGCHTVGSLIEPVPPCVATTMSPATSSSTRTRRASEATTPSPIRWPGPAGESRPGPSAGSGRRSASPGGELPPTVVPDTSSPTRERSHRRGPPRRPEETGIRQRFGAIGKTGSIAIVERLWRTLKEALGLGSLKPPTRPNLKRRFKTGLLHYAYLRPHRALAGATKLALRPLAFRPSLLD